MNSESPFTAIAPPQFDGTNYQAWAVRMETYLDANDLWEAVEQVDEVPDLPGIFVGYSLISKAYRIYQPQTNKVIVSRDVQFFELDNWSWDKDRQLEVKEENEDVDDAPTRGTRPLSDIYQNCNVAVMELARK
ncbi:hypothetical protein L6164_020965 [Bauhinia variegata]|uniref:Uncharacterized protein n=1 Tax=Bauhinia variegata TaxID=167791 RepID=A0ACB9MYR4_BAUVA|nr:hypothetical protein L6164_020965 [Bauhinia variegata]